MYIKMAKADIQEQAQSSQQSKQVRCLSASRKPKEDPAGKQSKANKENLADLTNKDASQGGSA
jgi:hypothetical protein